MTNKLISTTAALALLAGTSFAFAQTGGSPGGSSPGTSQSGGAGGSVQRDGGSGTAGQDDKPGRSGTETQTPRRNGQQGQQQQRGQGQQQQGQQQREGGRDGQRTGQAPRGDRNDRAGGNERERGDRTGGNDREQNRNGGRNRETTGSAPASKSVTTEQRTRIHEHRSRLSAGRVDSVNFSVSVGTVVPRSVRVQMLPAEIVEIVPEYRGYKYILVRDEILIIDPETLRIVAVIDA